MTVHHARVRRGSGPCGIQIPTRQTKFVLGPNGETLDIGHTYAAPRSDLNRGDLEWPPRDFLRWANTHGGDSWQVMMHADSDYAPPDQRRGNTVGMWLSEFYRNPANQKVPLSEAMRRMFRDLNTTPLDMDGNPRR